MFLGKALSFSTQEYKWVLANYQGSLMKCRANLAMDLHPIQGRAKGLVYRLSFYFLLAMLDHIMDALKVQSHLTRKKNGKAKNGNDCNAT